MIAVTDSTASLVAAGVTLAIAFGLALWVIVSGWRQPCAHCHGAGYCGCQECRVGRRTADDPSRTGECRHCRGGAE